MVVQMFFRLLISNYICYEKEIYFQKSKKFVENGNSLVEMIFWLLIWKYICHEKEIYFQESKKIVENRNHDFKMFFQILSRQYIPYEIDSVSLFHEFNGTTSVKNILFIRRSYDHD